MKVHVGLVAFVGFIYWALANNGGVTYYLDIPSVIYSVGATFFLAITKYNIREILNYSDEVASSLIDFSILGGAISIFLGVIQILQNMSEPSSMGSALVVLLLPIFYSLLMAAFFYALKTGLRRNQSKKINL